MSGIPAYRAWRTYFGRLFVTRIFYKDKYPGRAFAECECTCGSIVEVRLDALRSGATNSCGCYNRDMSSKVHTTHGESRSTVEYIIRRNMLQRCYNKKNPEYIRYGTRGITVHKPCRSKNGFPKFLKYLLATIGRRPSFRHSLDRIDNDGNYEPGNLKWSTALYQARNRRRSWRYDISKDYKKDRYKYRKR